MLFIPYHFMTAPYSNLSIFTKHSKHIYLKPNLTYHNNILMFYRTITNGQSPFCSLLGQFCLDQYLCSATPVQNYTVPYGSLTIGNILSLWLFTVSAIAISFQLLFSVYQGRLNLYAPLNTIGI